MKTCNATCERCRKRFHGFGVGLGWLLCPWCRYRHYAWLLLIEGSLWGFRGLAIGAGFFVAAVIAHLFFNPGAWR